MSYAQADFEVIQELDGIRLSLYLAVRHEEYLDGVCKLSPAQLSRKYAKLKNESNTARIRKQMINDGWLVQAVGGVVTKKFNTTANIAVLEKDTAKIAVVEDETLQKLQDTANIAVNPPETEQESTAKIAGTLIANNDEEFKSLNYNSNSNELEAPAVNGTTPKPKKKKSTADERTSKPIIQAFWQTTGRYPKKDSYDFWISVHETDLQGEQLDVERMKRMFQAWTIVCSWSPTNHAWFTNWYRFGIPPDIQQQKGLTGDGFLAKEQQNGVKNGKISNGHNQSAPTAKQVEGSKRLSAIIADAERFESPTIN